MLDYPVICQGKNQAANGCSTNLEGNSETLIIFTPAVMFGLVSYFTVPVDIGGLFGFVNVGPLSCFNRFFFPFFLASELEFFRRAPVVLLFL